MEEDGVVIESAGGRAIIRVLNSGGGCEGCGSAGSCKSAGDGRRVMEADDPFGVLPGQCVTIRVETRAFLKASFLVYMVPVIFLFIGAFVGGRYGPELSDLPVDICEGGGGVLFLVLSIAILRLYDWKIKKVKGLRPVIVRVKDEPDAHS